MHMLYLFMLYGYALSFGCKKCNVVHIKRSNLMSSASCAVCSNSNVKLYQTWLSLIQVSWESKTLFSTMITSRGLGLLKIAYRSSQNKVAATNLRPVRLSHDHYHGSYREVPPEEKKWVIGAEIFGGILWWWVLWHFWHDFGHIVGEFPYPDPSKWTDEELGILPDDADE